MTQEIKTDKFKKVLDDIVDNSWPGLLRGIVSRIETLERQRCDARTTDLLVSARKFLADVETYFTKPQ